MATSLSSNSGNVDSSLECKSHCCRAYVEELLPSLKMSDLCLFCKQLVAFHERKPIVTASSYLAGSGSSSSANAALSSNAIRNLPKWKVDIKQPTMFLKRIEQVLSGYSVDESSYTRALLISVENVSESAWIKTNIIETNKSWSEAKELFTKHFGLHGYEIKLINDYENCKQLKHESVQKYADRFTQLCDELDYPDTDKRVIQHYIIGLLSNIQIDFKRHLHVVKMAKGADVALDSLKQVVEMTLDLNLFDLNNQMHSLRTNDNGESKGNNYPSSTKKKLYCKNHPDSTTHSTAECRSNPQKSTDSSDHSRDRSKITLKVNGKPVKCHTCGGNHYANDPACPQKADRVIRSDPSAANLKPVGFTSPPSTNFTKPAIAPAASKENIQGRSLDFLDNKPAPTDSSSVGIIDRSLPENVILPDRKNVMFLAQDKVFNTLVDTGATTSFIDETLAKELQLTIEPSPANSRIGLAHANLSAARIGRIRLDEFTALFPFSDRKTITLSHTFEVLPLTGANKDYHFVVGSDLIPSFFPEGIPLCYVPPSSNSNGKPSIIIRAVTLPEMTADTGYLELPPPEQPNRPVACTPAELEHIYSEKRNSLLQELAEPLFVNEKITGFCNLPESVVKLEIDPSKENSLYIETISYCSSIT